MKTHRQSLLVLLTAGILGAASVPAADVDPVEVVRGALKADRRAVVAGTM